MKRCFTSLVIRKMQTKTIIRHCYIQQNERKTTRKYQLLVRMWNNQSVHSIIADGSVNRYNQTLWTYLLFRNIY